MSFYSEIQDTAQRLLVQFGQDVTLTRTTGGGVDPVTGADTSTTTTLVTTGVLRRYPDSLVDGSRILSTDRQLVLAPGELPDITDTVEVNGETLAIQEIETSSPAGTDLVYFARVRA